MKVGYFAKEITPPCGCYLSGNHRIRIADSVADPLYVRAFAAEQDGLALILCYDLVGMDQVQMTEIRTYLAEKLALPVENILLTCTHTHTAPNVTTRFFPKTEYLMRSLPDLSLAAAQGAILDLAETSAYFAQSELQGVTFNRRYLMKDGTCKTNPGRRNPDIVRPLTPPDETISILNFVREGKDDILLVNFQVHADVCGEKDRFRISADYPGVLCRTLENALPGTRCVFYNGTCGDLNHIDVHCPEWDANNGPAHAVHMGRTIAGKVLSMLTKARPIALGAVRAMQMDVTVPARKFTPEELARSEQYMTWYLNGESDKIPTHDGKLVVKVYEALGILLASESGGASVMPISGLTFGDVAFVGFPGEAFCEIGKQTRDASEFPAQFILGITNGYADYFPMKDAYEVDGYESRSSPHAPGVGEIMCDAGKAMVKKLKEIN